MSRQPVPEDARRALSTRNGNGHQGSHLAEGRPAPGRHPDRADSPWDRLVDRSSAGLRVPDALRLGATRPGVTRPDPLGPDAAHDVQALREEVATMRSDLSALANDVQRLRAAFATLAGQLMQDGPTRGSSASAPAGRPGLAPTDDWLR